MTKYKLGDGTEWSVKEIPAGWDKVLEFAVYVEQLATYNSAETSGWLSLDWNVIRMQANDALRELGSRVERQPV